MTGYGIPAPAFRLPSETRLGAVTLQVADLLRSLAYYRDVLGLTPFHQSLDEAVLGAGPPPRLRRHGAGDPPSRLGRYGAAGPIVLLRERRGVGRIPRGGLLGLYHFAILLPDRASLARFVVHLGSRGEIAGGADHAVSESLYLTDPDGLGIEVYADRPREAWRVEANGQLHMITAPLDLPELVDAARGESWTGMPAGTRLGHVHLHVGDLDEAAAFYHSALGFDKTVWTYPGALFLSAGGYHHHLATNTWSAGPPADDRHARLLSWDIVVPDAEQAARAAESLRAAGYDAAPIDSDSWRASDPWGTTLHLVGSR